MCCFLFSIHIKSIIHSHYAFFPASEKKFNFEIFGWKCCLRFALYARIRETSAVTVRRKTVELVKDFPPSKILNFAKNSQSSAYIGTYGTAGMDKSKNRTWLKRMFITCAHCQMCKFAIKTAIKRKMFANQKFRKSPKCYCAIDYCICGKLYVAFKKFYALFERVCGMSVRLKWMQCEAVSFRLIFLMHKGMKHMEMLLFISKSFVGNIYGYAHNICIACLRRRHPTKVAGQKVIYFKKAYWMR